MGISFNTRITLLQRLQDQHDEVSWDEFIRFYRNYIFSIIYKMDLSAEIAEELTQEVLVKLWHKIPSTDLKEIKRFRAWIATVTKNCVLDYFRKQTRETEHLKKAAQNQHLDIFKQTDLPKMDEIAEQQWKIHIANLALENITPFFSGHAMEVFQLSLQGVSAKDIAAKLGLEVRSVHRLKGRVKTRLVREVEYLRNMLE
jgi:RNA polymerase sigma factor (sigma-70 family)